MVGNFTQTATTEIRTTLTLEDTPTGIPGASYPLPEDLEVRYTDYPIAAGDTLGIEIYELRERQIPYQAQALVSSTGTVNLPVVERITAAGLTVPEFEEALEEALRAKDVLRDPELTVTPLFLQNATYSIFGIGVSASNNAPLRAGTFPIRRPDLRVLEAINQVGGLNEFVTEVYVFRYDVPLWAQQEFDQPRGGAEYPREDAPERRLEAASDAWTTPDPTEETRPGERVSAASPEQELIEAVVDADRQQAEAPQLSKAVEELLEPDSPQPYLWVNNEFVPNPAYRDEAMKPGSPPLPSIETITPTVNWARIAGDIEYRIIGIPAEHLRNGNPEVNIVIRSGDVIRIISGEIGIYYVMGQVNRVGAFRFNAESITLKAAIAAAGGLSRLAWPDRCTVYRRIGQREQMIQVDLDRVFAGKDADFTIKRGDIVNVGTHPFAPFLQRIRGLTLPTPVTDVGYSFLYARNYADIDSYTARINPDNKPDRYPGLFP